MKCLILYQFRQPLVLYLQLVLEGWYKLTCGYDEVSQVRVVPGLSGSLHGCLGMAPLHPVSTLRLPRVPSPFCELETEGRFLLARRAGSHAGGPGLLGVLSELPG